MELKKTDEENERAVGMKDERVAFGSARGDSSNLLVMSPSVSESVSVDGINARSVSNMPVGGRFESNLKAIAKSRNADFDVPNQQEPAVQVRSDFPSTLMWQPDVHTGGNG